MPLDEDSSHRPVKISRYDNCINTNSSFTLPTRGKIKLVLQVCMKLTLRLRSEPYLVRAPTTVTCLLIILV